MHCRSDCLQMHRTSEIILGYISCFGNVLRDICDEFSVSLWSDCSQDTRNIKGVNDLCTASKQATLPLAFRAFTRTMVRVPDGDLLDIKIPFGIFSLSLTSLDYHRGKFIVWTVVLSSVRFVGQNFQDPFYSPAYALCLKKKQKRNEMTGTSPGEQTFQK